MQPSAKVWWLTVRRLIPAASAICARSRTASRKKALNFLTPHQKWGIHSTYSENLLMQTLSRGGPIVWISETDARAGH